MLMKVTMIGGEALVNVVRESKGYLLVNCGTFFAIYSKEFNGKRNVPHVGEQKYIERIWKQRYN
jgi:hypothetical protein